MTIFPANTDLQIALLIATTLAVLLAAEWIVHVLSFRLAPAAQQRQRAHCPSTSLNQRKL